MGVHEGGYRVELGDGGPRFYRPDGTMLPVAARAPGEEDALDACSLLAHDASARVDTGWIVSLLTG